MTYTVDETGEMQPVDIDEVVEEAGAALVIRSGGGRAGESFTRQRRPGQHRPQPRRRGLPRRCHRLAQPRPAGPPPRRPLHRRPRIAERDLRQPPPDRVAQARRRRRDPGRQVQAQLTWRSDGGLWPARWSQMGERSARQRDGARPQRKALTIGAVCKILESEFDDISISKIRYLEDQKLLTPRRTAGGTASTARPTSSGCETILRLQRDEFLPLRVIRQELAAGADVPERRARGGPAAAPCGGRSWSTPRSAYLTLEEVIEETGAREELIRELEDFGMVQPEKRDGRTVYDETDREIVRSANELSRFGVAARNLRVFRSSADREAKLLEALLGPSLRSRNPQRRKEALESLESLAATVSHLKHLLLVRDLRRLAGTDAAGSVPGSPAGDDRGAASGASGRWSPTPTTCRAGGRGRAGSRTSSEPRPASAASGPRCCETKRGRGVRADFRCIGSTEASASSGSRRSRAPRSSGTCAARRSRSSSSRSGRAPRSASPDADAARPLAAGLADDEPRPGRIARRGARRHRAGSGHRDGEARTVSRRRAATRSGGAGATRRSQPELDGRRAGGAARADRRAGASPPRPGSTRSSCPSRGRCPGALAAVGEDGVLTGAEDRLRHAAGRSYADLARLRSGRLEAAPDAVVLPARRRRARRVLEPARRSGVAVVPFGGGTSVVGGVEPLRGGHERADQPRPGAAARRRGRSPLADRAPRRRPAGARGRGGAGRATGSPSATSRSPSSTRRSAASPRPAPPARPPAATGASTRWSARSASSRRRGSCRRWRRRTPPPARLCASCHRLRGVARRDPRRHRARPPGPRQRRYEAWIARGFEAGRRSSARSPRTRRCPT